MKSLQHNNLKINTENIFVSHEAVKIFMPIPPFIFCSYDLNDNEKIQLSIIKKME